MNVDADARAELLEHADEFGNTNCGCVAQTVLYTGALHKDAQVSKTQPSTIVAGE